MPIHLFKGNEAPRDEELLARFAAAALTGLFCSDRAVRGAVWAAKGDGSLTEEIVLSEAALDVAGAMLVEFKKRTKRS
jgi:hypothetical protein